MNNNLTIDTLSFNLSFNDKAGSERREVSRGVNLPEVMTVRSQSHVSKAYGFSGRQTTLRFDRFVTKGDETGTVPVSAYLTVVIPNDTGVTNSDVLEVISRVVEVVGPASGLTGLALNEEIFVNSEQ